MMRLPGLLLVALLAFLGPVICQAQTDFNMDFTYGFFPGSFPQSDPSTPQLEALICQTQVFLSQVMQETIGNPTVTVKARDIAYNRDPATESFLVTFRGEFNTAEGGQLPTEAEITAAFDYPENTLFNATKYIFDHVHQATPLPGSDPANNYFINVNEMGYTGNFGDRRAGTLAEAVCEETVAPTFPGGNITDPPMGSNASDPNAGGMGTDPGAGNGTDPNAGGAGTDPGTGGNGTDPGTGGTDPGMGGNGTDPGTGGTDPGMGGNGTDPGTGGTDPLANGTATRPPDGNGTDTDGPLANGTATRPPTGNETMAPTVPTDGNATTPTASPGGGTGPITPTIAPTPMVSVPDTDNLVYFTLEYGFEEGEARGPTTQEVEALICRTNLFYRDEIRNFTGDMTVQSEATNIDWNYNEQATQPVILTFTANVTKNDYQEEVPQQVVYDAMQVDVPDIERYIQNYVWGTPEGSVFQKVDSANFTNEANIPIPFGRLPMYACPITEAPSMAPSVSPAPTTSEAPSMPPSASPAPTSSKSPSESPSISPAPTKAPTPFPTPTSAAGGPTDPTPSTDRPVPVTPTISPMPTVSASPTNSPTVSAAPTTTPMPTSLADAGGPATRQEIKAKYYVSNEKDITDTGAINASGLSDAWPVFAREVVGNVTAARNRRRLRAGQQHRRLAVGLEPGSASIDLIEPVDCPEGSIDSATCHNVTSSYVLLLRGDEDPAAVEQEYGQATINGVDDGSYQAVLDRVEPESDVTIGIIPKPKSDGGMPLWLIILIVLLALLCCCCILAALFFLMQNRGKEEKELEPYDEEGFVYDFLIPPNEKPQTEVDDDATKAVDLDDDDDQEKFDDEDEDKEEFNEDEDDDEDKEEFDEDEEVNAVPPDDEPVAIVEADESEDDEDEDKEDSDDEGEKKENWEDENELEEDDVEERKVEPVELDDDDDEDETTPLVPVADEMEAPADDSDEEDLEQMQEENTMILEHAQNMARQAELDSKPDPDQEFGGQDEPEGTRAANLENIDDDSDGAGKADPDEDWDDEPPTDTETAPSGADEETTQEGGGDDEDWQDEGEPKEGSDGGSDGGDWDDGGEGEGEGAGDEEWDDDDKDGVGEDEGWEDDGEGGEEDGWDDEDEAKK